MMAALQSEPGAAAMEYDGVLGETLVIYIQERRSYRPGYRCGRWTSFSWAKNSSTLDRLGIGMASEEVRAAAGSPSAVRVGSRSAYWTRPPRGSFGQRVTSAIAGGYWTRPCTVGSYAGRRNT